MRENLEKQNGGKLPLTEERIKSLSFNKTKLGNELNVGDHLYFAFFDDNQKNDGSFKKYEFIALTEKEIDQYELVLNGEDDSRLPVIKFKNI